MFIDATLLNAALHVAAGTYVVLGAAGDRQTQIDVGRGPTGLRIDEARARLYVLNKFDATISVVDLAGNVAEWTASDYSAQEKEVRGGSWTDTAKDLRSSARSAHKPGYRSDLIGFRCAFHEAATPQ